jgi:hypothetical protein
MKIYEYNTEIDAFVGKATGKIVALEYTTWGRKVALSCLVVALAIINLLLLILKLT